MGDRFKQILTRIGARIPPRGLHYLNSTLNYMAAGHWLREFGADTSQRYADRTALYDMLAAKIGAEPVLYLEFGVFQGDSMRYWSRALRHADSRLHGFDTFTGLPSNWNPLTPRGTFSTGGVAPTIDDPRVTFVKGLFQETLPDYDVESGKQLLVNLDADLYESTIYVLRRLRDAMVPGTYLLFDEFAARNHELRAFEEFLHESKMTFEFVGSDRILARVLLRRVA